LNGIFLLDDYVNLKLLGTIGGITDLNSLLSFVFGNQIGPTGRPISMLAFAIDDQFWPGSARTYKYNNLMIHNICGLLVFLLTYYLATILKTENKRALLIGFLCAAYWLFHPFNVSTTLYIIQRMTQLSSLFVIAGIVLYILGRITLDRKHIKAYLLMTTGVVVFGSLAFFSKENGVLLVFYILVVEFTLFQKKEKHAYFKYWFSIFILIPVFALLIFFAKKGFYINHYGLRDFTLQQRLLTESRIFIDYIYSIVIPPINGTGLIHDDINISTSLLNPITTLFSLVANLGLFISAIYLRKQFPVYAFSILWFYAGHIMESTFIPLELYFEHRNYLPMVGLIFGLMYYLVFLYDKISQSSLKKYFLIFPVLLIMLSALITHQSAKIWENPGALFSVWANEHPTSLRAQRIYGQYFYINSQPDKAVDILKNAYQQHPYDISLVVEIVNIACMENVNSPYQLNNIPELLSESKYTDGFWGITRKFVDNVVEGKCSQYDINNMIDLLDNLTTLPDIKKQKAVYAKLLFLKSDLHVLNRQLSPAIELLDEAYKYQPTVTIPVRQIQLLLSANLYKEALEYVDIAKTADSYRRRFHPSEMNKILKLEQMITSRI